jgi:hypothetical protein
MSGDADHDAIEFNLYLLFWLSCRDCADEFWPSRACWDGVPNGEAGAQVFTQRAAIDARAIGWTSIGDYVYCPACAGKHRDSSTEIRPSDADR